MPEPLTIVAGAAGVLLVLVLARIARVVRLRHAIDQTAGVVAAEQERLDRLAGDLARASGSSAAASDQEHGDSGDVSIAERVAEAEDRLDAVSRLHAAQVSAWNALAGALPWRLLGRLGRQLDPTQPRTARRRFPRRPHERETA